MTRTQPMTEVGTPFPPSRWAQRIERRYENQLFLLAHSTLERRELQATLQHLLTPHGGAHDMGVALRLLRQLTLYRLQQLDCQQHLPLDVVTRTMTDLAEITLDAAYQHSWEQLAQQHGTPRTANGGEATLCIIGMGKLGARELNVSSDIDLIYVYDEDGQTSGNSEGRGALSNQEFFARLIRGMQTLIGDTTEHGQVFRVDLALRPNGNSGPSAVSLGALEEYFHVQGREWERFAWLKSRVIAPRSAIASDCAQQLRSIVVPFVFRRYLDYNVFDSLRGLHQQIREHAQRRSAGRPERLNDVKLSRGGIREIEFTVQLLQVVRGGQFPELRTRPTCSALDRLAQAGLMPASTAQQLQQAYTFLRQVEHRIQYLDDQQTHVLPTEEADLDWIARSLGLADVCALMHTLDSHRELVAQEFDALLGGSSPSSPKSGCKKCHGNAAGSAPPTSLAAWLEQRIPQLPDSLRPRLQEWQRAPRLALLKDSAAQRLGQLLERSFQWLAQGEVSDTACLRHLDWLEPLLRRESYLALLWERPSVHQRLLRILGAASWPARYLLQHPGVIDELVGNNILQERFDPQQFETELQRRHDALQRANDDDEESLLNLLRRAHHAEVFRILVRDLESLLSVEQVADDLSALADSVLRIATRWCWQRLKNHHREEPAFAIIGYGKLGGKELGYGSDLDLVFVYDDDHENAGEIYAALVRKLINWLTVKTGEGDLYEIDTALRPNGNSGLLVTSMAAYEQYQTQRGSNTAWTWEHQAMTRARCVLGPPALRQRFDGVRQAVLTTARDTHGLRQEITAMRERMRQSQRVPAGRFDIKYSPGGMVDIEFVVQFLVLAHAPAHPTLCANAGNIALLQQAQTLGILPAPMGDAAAAAYRLLRQEQHHARLNESVGQLDSNEAEALQAPGLALYAHVLPQS
ncbi:bifunctional [glutamate--ammonia ligase]-adenylyl-L-tyrosine phosphorylase/[glutamate--ammonia-ligase] adenylyltransferase [Curvibacter sp. CHRR-16]|uniref:bifunctional [glutamate--ammonia ligase]-adenylyl-L-tyrosine phosphorylase/[glutamate--ammonia-ligase] adenylyltransferase n=1 Tax=Curvibacter sp. CHRR-16 TaxID=2835872 RepID=UPI001BDAB22F|nr:bifunctional [glutamate--ammonia ligase]-adenylyl-L-tyrosine phosphorylase/[glutamate--ammonia-ligase] adenylyltransferase [Curvibacter sp. CHRR-16]MBT0570427.1 bifunctional [glutamate--ammonia ligase]-adenylyl-L-tyrosine phosphorylase/[glutamate--ammonia-ligase] adenylyltransferase [Curvibacter sp. CHRR-16]